MPTDNTNRQPTPAQAALIAEIKAHTQRLGLLINEVAERGGDARCAREAGVRLEEAAMWAVKGVMA